MDTVIHYFSAMSIFLVVAVLVSMWLTSLLMSMLDGRFVIALLSFFVPPIGIIHLSYMMLLESKGLTNLSGASAFKALIKSFKKEQKCLLKH